MNFPLHPARCTDFIDNYRAFVDSGDTYPDWDFLDHVNMTVEGVSGVNFVQVSAEFSSYIVRGADSEFLIL